MDVGDGRDQADRIDAGGVRETGRGVDERESGDRSAVEAKQIERLVSAVHIRGGAEGGSRSLHLDDDWEKRQGMRLH
jgi:hypothetical protein